MRKLAALFAAISLLACASSAAGAGGGPPPPQIPRIPGSTWWHVELNVTIKKQPHTLIVDRGKITEITTTQLTLRERDGSSVPIPLTAQTIVTIDNRPATISNLRRRMTATTLIVDGGAAVRVRAASF
jgi:hypothetical protein